MNKVDSLWYLSLSCKPCCCSTYVTFLLWSCLRKPCLFFILFNSPHPSTIFSFKTCTVACVCSIGRGLFFDLDQLMSSVNGTLWTYFMNYWIIQFLWKNCDGSSNNTTFHVRILILRDVGSGLSENSFTSILVVANKLLSKDNDIRYKV